MSPKQRVQQNQAMNRIKKNTIVLLIGSLFCFVSASGQQLALKTDLIGWSTVSPNLGMEWALGRKHTMDLHASVNPFEFDNDKHWKHWFVMPEYRYWFCERFHGHFLGIHAVGGEYNIGKTHLPFGIYSATQEARFEGWGVGGGLSYGYQWLLSRHWSVEGVIGVGYVYSRYEKYPCAECGTMLDKGGKHYVGPTKIAINVIYVF